MDIYLSINNREQVLRLPVMPPSFTVSKPAKNGVFETVSGKELLTIGEAGLKEISFSSFFPNRDYPFLRDRTYRGDEYVYILDSWRTRKIPIRLIITGTSVNMAAVIDDFRYTIGQDGDIRHDITFKEFAFGG